MRVLPAFAPLLLLAAACCRRPPCVPSSTEAERPLVTASPPEPAALAAPPARRPRFFNDGEFDTYVTRPENVFAPGLRIYDVRDLLALESAEYELLVGIPDLALRRHGATYADISLGHLRVAGPEETHRFVAEALAVLRRDPAPR